MKNNIIAELSSLIEQVSSQFERFPWETRSAYIHWLSQTYFYVRHTTCFLSLTAARWGVKNREQQYHAIKHLREESGHDLLILRDVNHLDISIDDFNEWPVTQARE